MNIDGLVPATARADVAEAWPITPRDLGIGLHVRLYMGDGTETGVVVSIDRDADEPWPSSGPWCIVRWGTDSKLKTTVTAGQLLRIGRRLHWEGDPWACAADCDGAHYGDHLEPDAVCQRCGGNAHACYVDTEGKGCPEGGAWGPEV